MDDMDLLSKFFKQSSINQLEPARVHSLLSQSPKPFLLDVRTAGEYKNGHISGAVLIPLDELTTRMGRIPKSREIICICESGSRSSLAARQLSKIGYKVNNLHGGMNRWQRAGLQVKKGMD
jgi:rhodanese-related sulfurtransferase